MPKNSDNYPELIRKYGLQIIPKKVINDKEIGFKINDQNSVQLMAMMEYFAHDNSFLARDDNYSFDKGLMLLGDIGTGKSIAMKLFRNMLFDNTGKGFRVIACRHIVREFMAVSHYNTLDQYGRKSYAGGQDRVPVTICFDDLGLEDIETKQYGNATSVMGEILLDRYEEFIERQMITHVTTNHAAKALGDVYGERVRDRMREMFNTIVFTGLSFRK